MTWPTYPTATGDARIDRWTETVRAGFPPPARGARGTFGIAADVWRDGAHIWRSYPEESGMAVDDWAAERWSGEFGTMYPRDYDSTFWSVPDVALDALDLVPTPRALRWVGPSSTVVDALASFLAIGQLPGDPVVPDLPRPASLHTRLHRDAVTRLHGEGQGAFSVLRAAAAGVSVRLMIGRAKPDDVVGDEAPGTRWTARLERRPVRAGAATDAFYPEGDASFAGPPDPTPGQLARLAKAALGITGHPASRQGESNVWHLARAPYRFTIHPAT